MPNIFTEGGKAPTQSTCTPTVGTGGFATPSSGSGTYTTRPGVAYLRIRMVGAGGGGGGSAAGAGDTAGSGGSDTVFDALTAAGGNGSGGLSSPGTGGVPIISGAAFGLGVTGVTGFIGDDIHVSGTLYPQGGQGAGAPFFCGGGKAGGLGGGAGAVGVVNTGSGGGGGSLDVADTGRGGCGGGSGAFIEAYISSPAATYSFTVGAGGNGGASGSGGTGFAGGKGADGYIEVTEYYS